MSSLKDKVAVLHLRAAYFMENNLAANKRASSLASATCR